MGLFFRLEFSYVDTSGNTDNQNLSGKLEFNKEEKKNRYYTKANALYTKDKEEETANKWSLEMRGERTFSKKFFGFIGANYITDKFSGYDYRASIGPGLGYDIIKIEKHYLKSFLSSLYNSDKSSEGAQKSDSYLSGKAAVNYTWQFKENLKFKQSSDYLFSFKNEKKYFINSETALEAKINAKLSLGISYLINYQRLLPSDEIDSK